MVSADKVRIVVVAEDALARTGLAALISVMPECFLAGQIGSDEILSGSLEIYRPDIIIWDVGLSPSLARLPADPRQTGIPVIALVPDAGSTGRILSPTVRGILPRNIEGRRLSAAIYAIANRLTVIDSNLTERILSTGNSTEKPLLESLTPRELEVFQLLAQGSSNKTIASQLSISEHTVKFHVNSILSKLGAESRTEAAARGSRLGLIRI